MSRIRVAVDVGGTFTDICIMDEDSGAIRIEKTASTPDDPMQAIMNGVDQGRIDLSQVTMFSHGTTVATNALITRRLPRTAMVCTEGFRDVVEIRRANKEDLWDTYKDVAKPYIPRRDRLTVRERVSAEGAILEALDEEAARRAAQLRRLRDDIVGGAGAEHADRDHRRLQRIDITRHDRLQIVDDLRAD